MASSLADPGLTDPAAADLTPWDISAETVGNGHPTLSSPTEINGFTRDQDPDQGSYEWGVEGIFTDGFESGDTMVWSATTP